MKKSMPRNRGINANLPTINIVLTYTSLYDDYETVDVHSFLKGIPTLCILHFITRLDNEVHYNFNNQSKQTKLIRDICYYVGKDTRKRIWKFLEDYPSSLLICTESVLYICGLSLQNYEPFTEDDDLDLCTDEYESVYKALLYCNQRWSDSQMPKSKVSTPDSLLLIDLPLIEFKFYKDFRVQLYKAVLFFQFCECDTHFRSILTFFCEDHSVTDWKEYILNLFSFYKTTLDAQYIKFSSSSSASDLAFFDQYIINPDNCGDLWSDHCAIKYFRDHFLFKVEDHYLLPISPDLLVDKLFQGLKFDTFQTILKHHLLKVNGKSYKNFGDYCSELGMEFSEPYLLYAIFEKIYEGYTDVVMFKGVDLKAKGIPDEPDLYIRIGKALFLFELKDVMLPADVIYSADVTKIHEAILSRMCYYPDTGARKGAGQLHKTIENIFNQKLMDIIDSQVRDVTCIYPIIVTTDKSFSAIGVNSVVMEKYNEIKKKHPINGNPCISGPTIVDLDILILCAYRLHTKSLDLVKMLNDYFEYNRCKLSPFNIYVLDHQLRSKKIDMNDIHFLFGDILSGASV